MSKNAERPARSGRGTSQKERPTFPSVSSRPRNESEGAAEIPEREFPAAERAMRRAGQDASCRRFRKQSLSDNFV